MNQFSLVIIAQIMTAGLVREIRENTELMIVWAVPVTVIAFILQRIVPLQTAGLTRDPPIVVVTERLAAVRVRIRNI